MRMLSGQRDGEQITDRSQQQLEIGLKVTSNDRTERELATLLQSDVLTKTFLVSSGLFCLFVLILFSNCEQPKKYNIGEDTITNTTTRNKW